MELTVNGNSITINKDGSVTIKGVISINGKSLPTDDGQEQMKATLKGMSWLTDNDLGK